MSGNIDSRWILEPEIEARRCSSGNALGKETGWAEAEGELSCSPEDSRQATQHSGSGRPFRIVLSESHQLPSPALQSFGADCMKAA